MLGRQSRTSNSCAKISLRNVPQKNGVALKVVNFDPNKDYKVQAGDTASAIASSHGITLDQLKALNPGKDLDALQVRFSQIFISLIFCLARRSTNLQAMRASILLTFSV